MRQSDIKEIVIERVPKSAIELALMINPNVKYSRQQEKNNERNNETIEQSILGPLGLQDISLVLYFSSVFLPTPPISIFVQFHARGSMKESKHFFSHTGYMAKICYICRGLELNSDGRSSQVKLDY